MTKRSRIKVLISAYACEPGKGSEPEVGWQWVLQMAKYHDVTVLTRSNNRPLIEKALEEIRDKQPVPTFVYHDLGRFVLWCKKTFHAHRAYYILWQKTAHDVVKRLHAENQFDLLHHVTIAGYRYTTAIWDQGVPCIWGPVGGMESIPFRLLPWRHPFTLAVEIMRNTNNALLSMPFHVIPQRAAASSKILVSTRETHGSFKSLGIESRLIPTVGIQQDLISKRELSAPRGPLEILFVGQMLALKGIELGIQALAASGTDARLTLIGSGPFLKKAQRIVRQHGLESRVRFINRIPREEVLKTYASHHIFLFPSLHDSGGFAVLEAMAQGLPVICLDCGGPALSVESDCGIRVNPGSRQQVISDLADAIRLYDKQRDLIVEHGENARAAIGRHYDWEKKGMQMNGIYKEVTDAKTLKKTLFTKATINKQGKLVWTEVLRQTAPTEPVKKPFSFFVFTAKGSLLSVIVVLLIAVIGFRSLSRLSNTAASIARDTLPGLSSLAYASESKNQAYTELLLLLASPTREKAKRYYEDIRKNIEVTSSSLNNYKVSINEEEDAKNFDKLLRARTRYLEIRQKILQLAISGEKRDGEYGSLFQDLVPAYAEYSASLKTLLDYNVKQGEERSAAVLRQCRVSQVILATFSVMIFCIGFLLGFFK